LIEFTSGYQHPTPSQRPNALQQHQGTTIQTW